MAESYHLEADQEHCVSSEAQGAPLKITHLLHTMAYGGIETVLINWLRFIDKKRLDVQIVVFANPGGTEQPFLDEAAKFGITAHTIPWSRRKPVFKAAKELKALLASHGSQVLHTHNTYADLVGYVAGRKLPLKLVATIYVWTGQDFGWKRNVLQKISAVLIKRFDLLTVQCEKARQESVDWGFDLEHVTVLPSGYELPPPSNLSATQRQVRRAERGVSDDQLVICNVARLYPEKGQARMLKIWKEIVRQNPDARLWIYGVGPLEAELKELCHELGLEGSVLFVGFTSNLMEELELCDIQLHTSFNEGVPIAICAGMAVGLPILSTAVGGIPEVIIDNETGLLVDSADEAGIESRLLEMIQSPDLCQKLGKGAKRFIDEEYSLNAAVNILAETYEHLTQ